MACLLVYGGKRKQKQKRLKYTIGAKALKGSKTGTKSSKKRRAQPTVKCVLQAIDNWLEKKKFFKSQACCLAKLLSNLEARL